MSYRDGGNSPGLLTLMNIPPESFLYEFPDGLDRMRRFGWLQRHGYSFSMHPLLQEIIITKFKRRFNSGNLAREVVQRLKITMLDKPSDKLFMVPFGERILRAESTDTEKLAILANHVAAVFIHLHDPEQAKFFLDIAYKYRKKLHRLKPDPLALSRIFANYVLIYRELGERQKCLRAAKRDLKLKSSANASAFDMLRSYNSLALFYEDSGMYGRSIQFHKLSISLREAIIAEEPDNIDLKLYLATAYNNIALALLGNGEADEAKRYQDAAIGIRETHLKDRNHPSFAQSYGNLAEILFFKGDLTEAKKYHKKTIGIYKANLEKDNFDDVTLGISLNNLSELLLLEGQVYRGKLAARSSFRIRKRHLPAGNFLIAKSAATYAKALYAEGKRGSATYYIELAISIMQNYSKRQPDLKAYREILTSFRD